MATVYSRKFAEAPAFTGGPTLLYTVPAGFLAVVRTISIVWGDVVVSGLDAWVQTGALTKLCRQTYAAAISSTTIGGAAVFDGRWVLNAGDTLSAQTAAGTCDIFVAGYELTLP